MRSGLLSGWSSRRIAGIATLILVCPWLASVRAGPDLWWHVHTGRRILSTGSIPAVDDLSFTAAGATWTNHEWLAEVIFGAAFDLGGGGALIALRVVLVAAYAFTLGAMVEQRVRHVVISVVTSTLAMAIMWPYLNLRVHTFTNLFVLWIVMLSDGFARGRRWAVPAATLLMVCWVNLHGGFLLGAVYWTLACGVAASRRVSVGDGRTRRTIADAAIAVAVVWCATIGNPQAFGLYGYLVDELGANHSLITEWQPADAATLVLLGSLSIAALWALVTVGRASPDGFAVTPTAVATTLATVGTSLATARHERFLALALGFAVLALSETVAELRREPATGASSMSTQRGFGADRRVWWGLGAIAVGLVGWGTVVAVNEISDGLRPIDDGAPAGAAGFVAEAGIGPDIVSELDWGGYLIWTLGDTHRVAVDGRNLTVYDDDWVDRYLRAMVTGTLLDHPEVIDPREVEGWLVRSGSRQDEALDEASDWVAAYRDTQATVWVPADRWSDPVVQARPVETRFG